MRTSKVKKRIRILTTFCYLTATTLARVCLATWEVRKIFFKGGMETLVHDTELFIQHTWLSRARELYPSHCLFWRATRRGTQERVLLNGASVNVFKWGLQRMRSEWLQRWHRRTPAWQWRSDKSTELGTEGRQWVLREETYHSAGEDTGKYRRETWPRN